MVRYLDSEDAALDARIRGEAQRLAERIMQDEQHARDQWDGRREPRPAYESTRAFLAELRARVTAEQGDWHRWFDLLKTEAEGITTYPEALKALLKEVSGPSRVAERLRRLQARTKQFLWDNFVPVGFKE